jgi:heme oxygenase (mycobilin-producing)
LTVVCIGELRFTPDSVEEALAAFHLSLKDSRAFEGCQSIEIVQSADDAGLVHIIERWQTVEHYQAYLEWRATPEGRHLKPIRPFLAAPSTMTVCVERLDV